jgi:hypothetical protein
VSPKRLVRLDWYRQHRPEVGSAVLCVAVGFLFWAQYDTANSNHAQSLRADARIAELGRQATRQSAASAQSAYAACRRQQEQVIVQREFVHLAVPRFDASRTPDEQVAVQAFYADLRAHHILTVPVCERPPDGS